MKRRGWGALAAGVLLAAGLLVACGGGAPERSRKLEHPTVEPGLWLDVDAEEWRRLEDGPIYHQGPRQPPVLRAPGRLTLPVPGPEAPGRPLVVQAVVSDTGRVARVRLLRTPPIPGLAPEALDARLVATLREARFEPARLDGEPVAVYFNLTLRPAAER